MRANDAHSFTVNHIASHGIGPSLYRNRGGFDPLRDMPGVCRVCAMPNVLIVRSELPDQQRGGAGGLHPRPSGAGEFQLGEVGHLLHLSGILFGQVMGVEVTHVPYRGTAPSMLAVLNGEVLFNIDNAPTSRPHVQSGALRAIGVSTARRARTMPDLPTLAEQGVAGFDVASWYGFAAPAATPAPVVAKLAGVCWTRSPIPASSRVSPRSAPSPGRWEPPSTTASCGRRWRVGRRWCKPRARRWIEERGHRRAAAAETQRNGWGLGRIPSPPAY